MLPGRQVVAYMCYVSSSQEVCVAATLLQTISHQENRTPPSPQYRHVGGEQSSEHARQAGRQEGRSTCKGTRQSTKSHKSWLGSFQILFPTTSRARKAQAWCAGSSSSRHGQAMWGMGRLGWWVMQAGVVRSGQPVIITQASGRQGRERVGRQVCKKGRPGQATRLSGHMYKGQARKDNKGQAQQQPANTQATNVTRHGRCLFGLSLGHNTLSD